jgi:hypothetical protein
MKMLFITSNWTWGVDKTEKGDYIKADGGDYFIRRQES